MTSPFLDRPLRPRHVVMREILDNCADTYVMVDMTRRGEPYMRETDCGQSLNTLVRDIIEGQWDTRDRDAPVAVLCISHRNGTVENVTEKVANAVIDKIIADREEYDDEGTLWPRPFLDNALGPNWPSVLPHGPGRGEPDWEAA